MNMNEIKVEIMKLNENEFTELVKVVEEKKADYRKKEIAELIKKIGIGTYASYLRGKVEVIGEVAAMNKKYLFLEMKEGNETHKRTLAYEDVYKVYDMKPVAQKPVESKPQPTQKGKK